MVFLLYILLFFSYHQSLSVNVVSLSFWPEFLPGVCPKDCLGPDTLQSRWLHIEFNSAPRCLIKEESSIYKAWVMDCESLLPLAWLFPYKYTLGLTILALFVIVVCNLSSGLIGFIQHSSQVPFPNRSGKAPLAFLQSFALEGVLCWEANKCSLMFSCFQGEKVLQNDEFTRDLFRFLQLLCEGHNSGKWHRLICQGKTTSRCKIMYDSVQDATFNTTNY